MESSLIHKLHDLYYHADDEKAAMVHLFGIVYAEEISRTGISAAELVRAAGLPKGYAPELSKGIKLSEYVELKEAYRGKF